MIDSPIQTSSAKFAKGAKAIPISSRPSRSPFPSSLRSLRDLCELCVLLLCVLAAAAAAAAAACHSEEKVVSYKPFFAGLEGAASNTEPVLSERHKPVLPEGAVADDGIDEQPGGTTRLTARNGLSLMRHIARTLAENDEATFVDQVLCEQTRSEYLDRGRDPAEAFRTLKRREKDINALFSRMPSGEQSPTVVVTPLGPRTQRLKVTGLAARDLKWTGFDMVLEGARWAPVVKDGVPVKKDGKQVMKFEPSNWRLRWFVE